MSYSFNGSSKVITLSSGTTSVVLYDLYSRYKDWLLAGNAGYALAMSTVGGEWINQSQGTKVPLYLFLLNGWKIKPQEADHTLAITDGTLLVDGGGDPFIDTTGDYVVRVNYQQPVQAIGYSTSGAGGLTTEQATRLEELWKLSGLDSSSPMTVTRSSRVAGSISLAITGDGSNTSTVTRQ